MPYRIAAPIAPIICPRCGVGDGDPCELCRVAAELGTQFEAASMTTAPGIERVQVSGRTVTITFAPRDRWH